MEPLFLSLPTSNEDHISDDGQMNDVAVPQILKTVSAVGTIQIRTTMTENYNCAGKVCAW